VKTGYIYCRLVWEASVVHDGNDVKSRDDEELSLYELGSLMVNSKKQ